jgi:hypothetical protein
LHGQIEAGEKGLAVLGVASLKVVAHLEYRQVEQAKASAGSGNETDGEADGAFG